MTSLMYRFYTVDKRNPILCQLIVN